MTVAAGARKVQYTGTGANTPLSTVFPFFDSGDLVVQKRVIATGVVSTLVLGTHYTVTAPTEVPGVGTVTPVDGATDFTANDTWTIIRELELSQETDYVENDSFPAEAHEAALDRLTLLVQEAAEVAARSLRYPPSDSASLNSELDSSVDRAEKVLFFDATGEPTFVEIDDISPGSLVFSSLGQSVATIASQAAMKALFDYVTSYGNTIEFWGAGTVASKPAAATFGIGIYYATDERALYYSTGAAWSDRLSLTELATYANLAVTSGFVGVATDCKQLYYGDGAALQVVRSLPPRYMSGYQMSRTGNDEITIGAGSCRNVLFTGAGNAADQINLICTSSMAKATGSSWSAGAAGGMLPSGVAYAAGWYHVFAIAKVDGTVDFALDTDVAGVNLLADAAITTVAGYAWARRIGSILIDGSTNVTDFVQSGDTFLWKAPVAALDNAIASADDTAGRTASLENVPPSVVVEAIINLQAGLGAASGPYLVSSGLVDSQAPSASAAPLANVDGANPGYSQMRVLTDGASPPLIRYRALSDPTMSLGIAVVGWRDNRGKDY